MKKEDTLFVWILSATCLWGFWIMGASGKSWSL